MIKTAIIYARVSTQEQANSGYSLRQQVEALRAYAADNEYEVIEAVEDPGQSGATLERPGMERVRDLVAGGGVDVVLAQDRDRFAREPAYLYILKTGFAEYGTVLRALNDRGDDSPEGELTAGILDQLAKFERAKTAERTRRGKLRKAREGRLVGGAGADYGYRYNDARDGYLIDEPAMQVVRRIFAMLAAGETLGSVTRTLNREGVEPPGGAANRSGLWNASTIRSQIVKNDVYAPHGYAEWEALADEGLLRRDVLARLDPDKSYGIKWHNQRRVKSVRRPVPDGNGGKVYKRRNQETDQQRSEWIPVPVPDAGVPIDEFDGARARLANNKKASNAGRRFWELSGGIAICGDCGRHMTPQTATPGKGRPKMHYYYGCRHKYKNGDCTNSRNVRAEDLETRVADFVTDLLTDAGKLTAKIDALIDQERRALRDPEPETKAWAAKITEIDRKVEGYWDLAASGDIPKDRMRAKVAELEDERAAAEDALADIDDRRERIRELERDRDALLRDYRQRAQAGGIATLTPEQRHEMYRRMRLTVKVSPGGYAAVDAEPDSFPAGLRVDLKHHMVASVEGVLPVESDC